MMKQCI